MKAERKMNKYIEGSEEPIELIVFIGKGGC
jgi:hypothetical protein